MDQAQIEIAATPDDVYDLVSDVTLMGSWSPETYRCEWLDGCTGPRVDARFKGWNKDSLGPLPVRWATTCTVTAADRGEQFEFHVRQSGATWAFSLTPTETGTLLTQTRTDGDKPLVAKLFALVVPNRDEKLQQGMNQTVQRLKEAAEQAEDGST